MEKWVEERRYHIVQTNESRPKMVGIKKKLDRREATRERKALAAAHLEKSIEKELLDRLRSKAYGDAPLNVNEDVWRQVLDMDRKGKAKEQGIELEEEMEMLDDESLYDEDESDEEGSNAGDDDDDDSAGSRDWVESDDESGDDMEDYDGEVSLSLHEYGLGGHPSQQATQPAWEIADVAGWFWYGVPLGSRSLG